MKIFFTIAGWAAIAVSGVASMGLFNGLIDAFDVFADLTAPWMDLAVPFIAEQVNAVLGIAKHSTLPKWIAALSPAAIGFLLLLVPNSKA